MSPDDREGEVTREVEDLRPVLSTLLPDGWEGAARSEDQASLDDALRRAWTVVYHHARANVRERQEAEDVAQEVFVRVLGRLASPDGAAAAIEQAYLTRTARNLLYDRWRRRDRNRADDAAYAGDRSGDPVGPEDEVVRRIEGEEVRLALTTLTPAQRQVLRLRIFEQLTADEVAAVVGRTPDWVRQTQHRALRALRDHLTRAEEPEP